MQLFINNIEFHMHVTNFPKHTIACGMRLKFSTFIDAKTNFTINCKNSKIEIANWLHYHSNGLERWLYLLPCSSPWRRLPNHDGNSTPSYILDILLQLLLIFVVVAIAQKKEWKNYYFLRILDLEMLQITKELDMFWCCYYVLLTHLVLIY